MIVKGVCYSERPGAYGVLVRNRSVLLTFQSAPSPEFQLPGGGIDPGESPLQALHREVREETGWGIKVIRRLGAYRRFTYMSEYDLWARKTAHIYLCRPTRVMALIAEPMHSAHWMSPSEATSLLGNGGDRHFMGQVSRRLRSKFQSDCR